MVFVSIKTESDRAFTAGRLGLGIGQIGGCGIRSGVHLGSLTARSSSASGGIFTIRFHCFELWACYISKIAHLAAEELGDTIQNLER